MAFSPPAMRIPGSILYIISIGIVEVGGDTSASAQHKESYPKASHH
jgi:hypothetical protein